MGKERLGPLLAIDSRIHTQVAMVGSGASLENYLYCALHQVPRLMTLLQVVTYAEARVCPVLRVLFPQTLMSVGVWSQEQ